MRADTDIAITLNGGFTCHGRCLTILYLVKNYGVKTVAV
jgi:hypothetical protein